MATIPSSFRAGDYLTWDETEAPTGTTAIRAYLRTSFPTGAALDAVNTAGVWRFELLTVTSTALNAGSYLAQFVATVAGNPITYREVRFEVLPSLAYTMSPIAIETRTAKRIRLDNIEAAIDALTGGAQQYQVGVGSSGRMVRRADLADLIAWRDRLKAEVRAEERADAIANGKGDPDALYTIFTPVS